VGLPLLEAMLPRRAHAADDARRMLFVMIPNGIHMQAWTPSQTGSDFELPPILAPLEPIRHKVHVLSGFRNDPAKPSGSGDHTSGVGSFLSCVKVPKSEIRNGTTIDQYYAEALGTATPVPSIRLGMDGDTGYCGDGGYNCAYSRNISWIENTPQSKLTEPGAAFDLLFSGYDASESTEDLTAIRELRQSVLDSAVQDATALQAKLGQDDRQKVQEYLDSVRDLENRIQTQPTVGSCDVGGAPGGSDGAEEKMRTLMDIMVKAFQCDQTRCISFMTGNAVSGRDFGFIGASGNHHSISHHGGSQSNYDKLQIINTWEMEQFAYLLTQLDNSLEADGSTILDNSMVFLSSEVSDGNRHNHDNLPVLLAGTGGGVLAETGLHSEFPDERLSNLFLTLLQRYGVDINSYGDDSTGTLEI
jgi:hypothetical protein